MDQQQLEQSNRAKYGDQSTDLIARSFQMADTVGFIWCILNVIRYLERFIRPGSTKAYNLTDLLKARDYLQRAIEMHKDYKKQAPLTEKIEGSNKPNG